jgi:hypothetical protein
VQPDIKIEYNAEISNGDLGVGWYLSGIPSIKRINSGNGVNFNGSDSYVSPQGFLVDISGNKSEFHTETESFYRFNPVYGSCDLSATEPCGWIVNAPSGTTYYYGLDDDGNDGNSRVLSGNSSGYKSWYLRKVSDLHNNSYSIKYKIENGIIVPEIIHYNNNNLKQRIIRFIFETRNDVEKKYVYGSLETRNKRLKSVIAASNSYCVFDYCSDGDQIRKYTLDYKYSAASGRSLLKSIQEFGSDDIANLPAQTFTYSEPNTSNVALSNSSITADFRESMSLDINGDSLTDILRYQAMGPNLVVAYQLSNGNGFGALTGHQTFPFGQWKLLTGDFNGDGYKDLIFTKGTSVKVKHLIMGISKNPTNFI